MKEIDLIIESLEEVSEKEGIFRVVKELEKYVQENNIGKEEAKRLFDASDDILLKYAGRELKILVEEKEPGKKHMSNLNMRNYISHMKDQYKFFVLKENGDEEKAGKKYNIFKECYEKNKAILDNVDFDFLDDRFLEIFSQEQYNTVACYPYIQKLLLEMDDKEREVFTGCFQDHNSTYKEESDWSLITEKLAKTISEGEYDELIKDIDLDKKVDLDKLTQLLSNKNYFNVKSVQQFEMYDEIKEDI